MAATLEYRMADYALGLRIRDLPQAVMHHAKRRVIDTVASAAAAYNAPPVLVARRMAVPTGGKLRARVWGSLDETSPELAAFANGTMLRYLDINDTYGSPGGTHPSDYISAVFAMAEALDASGADFLQAVAISYEIQCRVVDSVPFSMVGWDQAVLPGLMGCSLAVGRLLGLDREQMRSALALAVIPNLSTFAARSGGELSMWKGSAAANGARQCIFAALLAKEGMAGPYEAFEGVFGLWKMTMGKPHDIKQFADGANGVAFGVAESFIKKHPVRFSCQQPIDTALELRRKLDPAAIAALRIETPQAAYDRAAKNAEFWAPKTRETADHSMPVTVAMALVDGEVSPKSFERERFKAPEVMDIVRKTKVDVSEEFTRAAPFVQSEGVRNCRITATLRDGSTQQTHLAWTSADLAKGPSDAEINDKFARLSAEMMPAERRTRLLDLLWRLDEAPSVRPAVDQIRFN